MEPTAFWSSDGEVMGRRDMAGNWPSEWGAIVRRPIKNPNRCRLGFACWWRWGELNPRPRTLRYKIYMLVPPTVLERGYPVGREHPNPASSFLVRRYPKHARFTIL